MNIIISKNIFNISFFRLIINIKSLNLKKYKPKNNLLKFFLKKINSEDLDILQFLFYTLSQKKNLNY